MDTTIEIKKLDTVSETLTKMYDLGLDHAIGVVTEKRSHYPTYHELHYHLSDIIETLKSLKK